MSEDYFWGLTLTKDKNTETWDPDVLRDPNDTSNTYRGEHSLLLKQALLGPDAKDGEVNVVQVEAMGFKTDVVFPITVLQRGTNNSTVLDLLFPDPPVQFKLIRGDGPVHLLGNHSVGNPSNIGVEEVEEEEEFDEEEDIEDAGPAPEPEEKENNVGKRKNNTNCNSNAKRAKGDADAEA